MTVYIINRLIHGIIVIFIVSIFIFLVIHLLPGDPLIIYMAEQQITDLTKEHYELLEHEYGLDKPLPVQYINWILNIFRGDMGSSIVYKEKVTTLLAQRLPVTFHLGIMAFLLSSVIGVFFGVICAVKRGKWPDTVVTILANLGITTPSFWVGILLIYVFALKLGIMPYSGYVSLSDNFWESMRHAIFPVFCLSLFSVASLTRQTRSSMLEVIRQDYIRTARSKGLEERTITFRHAIKNAFIPVITILGVHVRFIFGGSAIIETVFNVPGIGRLMVLGIQGYDYQVIQSCVLVVSIIVILANLLVDVSYGWLDPRIQYD